MSQRGHVCSHCAKYLDGWRNVFMGALTGRNQPLDNVFSTVTNLIIVAAGATTLGIFTQKEVGDLSVFIWKMLGVLCATVCLATYLEYQGNSRVSTPIFKGNYCLSWNQLRKETPLQNAVAENNVDIETAGSVQSVSSLSISLKSSDD